MTVVECIIGKEISSHSNYKKEQQKVSKQINKSWATLKRQSQLNIARLFVYGSSK